MNAELKGTYTYTFEHAFDAKGRITVPSEWRSDEHERHLHVIPSKEGCLKVYPASFLSKQQQRLDEENASISDPRRKSLERLARVIQPVEIDQQGRIMIKQHMRDHAKLGREALLAGASTHFEIWNRETYRRDEATLTLEDAAEDIGI